MSRSQSRRRQNSSNTRTKFDVELPKINKTTLVLRDNKGKQNNFMSTSITVSYVEKVQWVIEPVDYDQLTDHQIDQEYKRLRNQLHSINDDVAKSIEKMNFRVSKKSKLSQPDPIHTLEVRHREIDNNNAILQRLKKEYEQLQKRAVTVAGHSKDDMEQQIRECRQKLTKMKEKNKQLMLRNKTIGNQIMNTDQLYDDIRRLQNEKQVMQRKKLKLQDKTDKVYESIANSQLKLQEISDDYTIAQNYFQEFHGKNQLKQEQKQMESKLRYAKHCLQVTQKKSEITQNTKQQKYHISLKNLENQVQKITGIEHKTRDTEIQIINSKKMINQLQAILKKNQLKREQEELLKQNQPVFFTEFQEPIGDRNNDKNAQQHQQVAKQMENTGALQKKNKTEAMEEGKDEESQDKEIEQIRNQQSYLKDDTKRTNKITQRLQTSNALDPQEEKDVIMELDQKFQYNNKTMRNRSRLNEKETELGDDLPEDLVIDDNDNQMIEFQTKVSEQRHNSKKISKGEYDLNKDLWEVESQLKKLQILEKGHNFYDQQSDEDEQNQ